MNSNEKPRSIVQRYDVPRGQRTFLAGRMAVLRAVRDAERKGRRARQGSGPTVWGVYYRLNGMMSDRTIGGHLRDLARTGNLQRKRRSDRAYQYHMTVTGHQVLDAYDDAQRSG
jgi:hypothetical protein